MKCEFCDREAIYEVRTLRPGATVMAGPYCEKHALVALVAGYDVHLTEKNETTSKPCRTPSTPENR